MNHLHQQEHEMVSKLGEKLRFFLWSYCPQFFIVFAQQTFMTLATVAQKNTTSASGKKQVISTASN